MFKKRNVHPKGKHVGDCVKRAFTVATGKEYRTVKIELNRLKRELQQPSFNSDKVWRTYIKNNGWEKISFPAEKGKKRMDGFQFTEKYPQGTFVLIMAGHLTVCVNGTIIDTWDCRHKCVYTAFKVSDTAVEQAKTLKRVG